MVVKQASVFRPLPMHATMICIGSNNSTNSSVCPWRAWQHFFQLCIGELTEKL
jgi:hypothetical protein